MADPQAVVLELSRAELCPLQFRTCRNGRTAGRSPDYPDALDGTVIQNLHLERWTPERFCVLVDLRDPGCVFKRAHRQGSNNIFIDFLGLPEKPGAETDPEDHGFLLLDDCKGNVRVADVGDVEVSFREGQIDVICHHPRRERCHDPFGREPFPDNFESPVAEFSSLTIPIFIFCNSRRSLPH